MGPNCAGWNVVLFGYAETIRYWAVVLFPVKGSDIPLLRGAPQRSPLLPRDNRPYFCRGTFVLANRISRGDPLACADLHEFSIERHRTHR